jgi:hypothetical protein
VDYEPRLAGGRNYGWRIREGTIATPGVPPTTPAFLPLTSPILDYDRSIGQAITGGYVYRGTQLPAAYVGRYFVGDSMTSKVASVGLSVNPATGEAVVTDVIDHTAELGGLASGLVSFGRDQQGELYLTTFAGRVVRIAPQAALLPGAPTGLNATVSGSTVTIRFNNPTSGAAPTGFRLEAGSTSGGVDVVVSSIGLTNALTATGVAEGRYYVRVRGESGPAVGPPSNEIVVVVGNPCTGPPAAPQGLSSSVNGTTVTLAWSAAAGAAGYVVEAGDSSGQANLATLAVGANGLTVGAPPGTYFVRVRAVNRCGTSGPSNEVIVTVP